MRLTIVLGSVRAGRAGLPVALWAFERASEIRSWTIDFVDLLDFVPIIEGQALLRRSPSLADPRGWRSRAARSDAVIWVSSVYRDGYSSALAEAFDQLSNELTGVPCISVVYGGAGAGSTGIAGLTAAVTALGMRTVEAPVRVLDPARRTDDLTFTAHPAEEQQFDGALRRLLLAANETSRGSQSA